MKIGRASQIVNGVKPTHALPSKVSIDNLSGMSRLSSSADICQCMNSSLSQDWYMIGAFAERSRIDNRSAILGNRSLIACYKQPWRQHNFYAGLGALGIEIDIAACLYMLK
jgi:hypothetical protein